MPASLIVGLSLLALPWAPAGDTDQFPLALHRGMEIDDLDRELIRLRDALGEKRGAFLSAQRLAQKGLMSRSDLERESADLKFQEAREAETVAYRALKVYERDVLGQAATSDERKAFALLLDWVRKKQAMNRVDMDYRAFLLKQQKALYARNAVSRHDLEEVEQAFSTAQASVELGRSREAQVMMELAARTGETAFDPASQHKIKADYLRSRVRYYEITGQGVRRQLDMARELVRAGTLPASQVEQLEKTYADSNAALDAERKALEAHLAQKPAESPRSKATRDPAPARTPRDRT